MIEKRYLKKKKYFLIIFFIFFFNLASIIYFQNRVNNSINKYENSDRSFNDNTSFIHTSNGPQYSNYFKYYKVITIENTSVSGTNNLINFPLLISLLDSDLRHDVQPDGDDIAFYNGSEWLDHEIELFNQTYNNTHAKLIAWVRVPILYSDKDTNIYMYYGNLTMGSQENPEGVWDINYKGVWHLSEDPTGTIYDSTSNSHDGASQGSMDAADQLDGQIDGSLTFDGTDDLIDCGNPVGLQITGAMTVETWFRANYFGNTYLISKNGPYGQRGWDLSFDPINSTHGDVMFRYALNEDGHAEELGHIFVSINNWYHLVGIFNPSTYSRLFINGQKLAENTTNIISSQYDATNPVRFGARYSNPEGCFDGLIDEVRISNIARSANWITTEYNNQYNPDAFYSLSSANETLSIYDFEYYKEITINNTKVSGTSDLIDFPVLISILDSDLKNHTQPDGDDIAFHNGNQWLDHEIEIFNQTYNETHAQLVAWIRVPILYHDIDTEIYMYYGNATMGPQENPSGVWDNDYAVVHHLEETSGLHYDSTHNSNNGTPYNGTTQDIIGKINGADSFDGIDDCIKIPHSSSLNLTGAFSIEMWIKFYNDPPTHNVIFSQGVSLASTPYYDISGPSIVLTNTNNLYFDIYNDTDRDSAIIDTINWNFNEWYHWVFVFDGAENDNQHIYINGAEVSITHAGTANISNPHTLNFDYFLGVDNGGGVGWPEPPRFYFNGTIDEVRISNIVRSPDWIAIQYNNQYDPSSFFTIGSEKEFDNTPPTYEKPIESSDPLELGETEVIRINISDPSGINQVKIEFESSNHSMNNTIGNTWEYDSWIPNNVGNYTYIIWMEDNCNNWNSTMGSIEVIDTTPPTYSNLLESQDPLQFGKNETIEINVFDLSGVNKTLLEYNLKNHTMNFIGGNKWSWSKWQPTLGNHTYKIYMQDNQNNWNMTSGNITVIDTTAPIIENLTESEDPLELGNDFIINIDVYDNESLVSTVLIELDGKNRTMNNILGNTYEYIWNSFEYIESGYSVGIPIIYKIYANDSDNNWALPYQASFEIKDTISPTFLALFENYDPLELGDIEIITTNCTDLAGINEVKIEFEGFNHSMFNIGGDTWQYNIWTPNSVGNYTYTIYIKDNNNNWNFTSGLIKVIDTTPPTYSDLTENPKIVELGDTLIISLNCTDLSDIKDVSIEFENGNHTMDNIYGHMWQYSSWMPNSIGNCTYKIYITDNNDNLNYVVSSILFQDTTLPLYTYFFEGHDPLELGDNQIFRIDVYDFAGINQTLIEFEGGNHSMLNTIDNTWEYNLWIPNNWIFYQYTIHMRDNSGNWNCLMGNFTVQDTTPPPSPILTNSPSGDVSGILVFDWSDGIDPSGISYYILIIDNESVPSITPGYVYIFNITNVGPESSYCELPEILPQGKYYYFLTQFDGVGQESSYTMGTFTVISVGNGSPENNTLIIIVIILASVVGSVTAIFIVRKKLKKEITPAREKISFKIITSHINKLSSSQLAFQAKKIQKLPLEGKKEQFLTERELTNEQELEIRIKEIKYLGEDLFVQGAYLEAQEQFKLGRDLLLNLGREEEAQLFSELISGIEGLIEEREKRLEVLEQIKNEGNSVQIFELYSDIIEISKKLKDSETKSFYQSELVNYFQNNQMNLIDLVEYRSELNQKAESLLNNNLFDLAAQLYKKCEKISQLLVKLELEEEIDKIEEFKNKKNECLKKINK